MISTALLYKHRNTAQELKYYTETDTLLPNIQQDKTTAYILEVPVQEGAMSATDFRNVMRNNEIKIPVKQKTFEKFFGKFNTEIFTFINGRLNG